MNVFLLYKDRDFHLNQQLPWNEQALIRDLELDTLFSAMAGSDKFLHEVAEHTVLSGINCDMETIMYRQEILRDCINNQSVVKDLFSLANDAIENEKARPWGLFNKWPSSILRRSLHAMRMYIIILKSLRNLAEENHTKFRSEGFNRFFERILSDLSDDYFDEIQGHLESLKFPDGILVSTRLGNGNKGSDYLLHKPVPGERGKFRKLMEDFIYRQNQEERLLWMAWLLKTDRESYTFSISPRDEGGIRALGKLKDEGINSVASTLAQSNDNILGFFYMLKTEIGFYIGALNLHKKLSALNEPVSFPVPVADGPFIHTAKGLYDACLALTMGKQLVGNDLGARHKKLVIITGANQGGKSTFLRSIGLSQLMMQSGLFVPAVSFTASLADSVLTHFKREEDTSMTSGKFDEELDRMNTIINNITHRSIILFNESFSATNEREGSEIAGQIVSALLEKNIMIFFVTHLYEFAHSFFSRNSEDYLFLRAGREADTTRTFRLTEGEPQQTSYGEDIYYSIFKPDKESETLN